MAYSRYATEMKDGDNNIYGLMDEEAREQLSDLNSALNVGYPYPFDPAATLIGSDGITKFYTEKKNGIRSIIIYNNGIAKDYYVKQLYKTSNKRSIVICGKIGTNPNAVYLEYTQSGSYSGRETITIEASGVTAKCVIDWDSVNAGYGQNLTLEKAKIADFIIDDSNSWQNTVNLKANKDGSNINDNAIMPNHITGNDGSTEFVDFTDYTAVENKYTLAAVGVTGLSQGNYAGVLTTGKIPISAFDGINTIKVRFGTTVDIQLFLIERVSGEAAGWKSNNMPAAFVSKSDDYYTINIQYLRSAYSGDRVVTYVALNFDISDYEFYYEQITPFAKKSLPWLKITKDNGKLPIIVDKEGNGEYTTIMDAVNAALDGDVIVIYPGEYEEQVKIPSTKNLTLLGTDKNRCVIWNDTCNYNTPPLWACTGYICNLTVEARYDENKDYSGIDRPCYALHLDQLWPSNHSKRKIVVENCIFRSESSICIGCGLDGDCVLEIRDCLCDSPEKGGIAVHPYPSTGETADIYLYNNVFKGNGENGTHNGMLFHTGGTDGTHFNTITIHAVNNIAKSYNGHDSNCFIVDPYNHGNTLSAINGSWS